MSTDHITRVEAMPDSRAASAAMAEKAPASRRDGDPAGRRLRVAFNPTQPLSLVFGGFEIQALTLRRALRTHTGVDPIDLSWWDRESRFDGIHFFGAVTPGVARGAKGRGAFVVCTLLLNYYAGWQGTLRGFGARFLGFGRMLRRIGPNLDAIVVVNRMQHRSVVRCLGVPAEKVFIIPNAIGDEFLASNFQAMSRRPFDVICCGTVCRRKNQLVLMQACELAGARLLLVGGVAQGDPAYAEAFHGALARSPGVTWLGERDPRVSSVRECYEQARAFALISEKEEQPISAMEARACGLNLLLSDRPFARDPLFRGALLADPRSAEHVARRVKRVLALPPPSIDPSWRAQVSEHAVGVAHERMYEILARRLGERSP